MFRRRHGAVDPRGLGRDRGKADPAQPRPGERLTADEVARIVNRSTFHTGFAPVRHYKR